MKGGHREGAGRKQGFAAKNAEEARRVLSEMVMRNIGPIGEALVEKAKKGDVIAIRELFDRAFGKAPQNTKIDLTETTAATAELSDEEKKNIQTLLDWCDEKLVPSGGVEPPTLPIEAACSIH